MKQPRLALLLALLVGLAVLRWWVPSGTSSSGAVVSAVVPAMVRANRTDARMPQSEQVVASLQDLSAGTRDAEYAAARNAFALRAPPEPPKPRLAPTPAAPRPFIGPPLPPPPAPPVPPPPPPLQIIGGWTDERGASVFVVGPRGVMQGRVGDVLLSEYRITQITPLQVLVTHVPTNRAIPLAVPSGTLPAMTAAR